MEQVKPLEKWIFLGDSLIEFGDWHTYFPHVQLLNLGMAGETVEGLLARLQTMADRLPSPDLILIMSGTNNVAMEEFDFIRSYEEIIDLLSRTFPAVRIIVNSLLPFRLPWLAEDVVSMANRAIAEMTRSKGMQYLDTYNAFLTGRGRVDENLFQEDGVHLSPRGYDVWASAIADL